MHNADSSLEYRCTLGTLLHRIAMLYTHIAAAMELAGLACCHVHCHTHHLHTSTPHPTDERTAVLGAHAPRRPPFPRAHCCKPWRLATPAAPRCLALTPAPCSRFQDGMHFGVAEREKSWKENEEGVSRPYRTVSQRALARATPSRRQRSGRIERRARCADCRR